MIKGVAKIVWLQYGWGVFGFYYQYSDFVPIVQFLTHKNSALLSKRLKKYAKAPIPEMKVSKNQGNKYEAGREACPSGG
ncbi:MAG: hypothetical protein IJC16_07920 [Rikenellaceae bacterium]|nr:hypothetical protein [Rikenellaceae bacterium]